MNLVLTYLALSAESLGSVDSVVCEPRHTDGGTRHPQPPPAEPQTEKIYLENEVQSNV